MMKSFFSLILVFIATGIVNGQSIKYPYPLSYVQFKIETQSVRMVFMDVKPKEANGTTVVLLHGKNFNGYYWKDVISFLADAGYRVLVPDQLGFGQSDKPNIHYSFTQMAENTDSMVKSLGLDKVVVIGHSMGGMLAMRYALMYPQRVSKLILENPIGLEDYREFVPFTSIDSLNQSELQTDSSSLKKYQQSYYPQWKPEYDQYVWAQFDAMQLPDLKTAAWASALTYDMIYQQPVIHEAARITVPSLLIIGQEDRTIVGKKFLKQEQLSYRGQYPQLGKRLHTMIKGSMLMELPGVGHIPHIQVTERFRQEVLRFLQLP